MLMSRLIVGLFSIGLTVVGTEVVSGDDYPSKPIRVFGASVASTNDFAARLIAPDLSSRLGQQVIVENRPGVITIDTVAKAPPDGYVLMMQGSNLWLSPFFDKVSYDAVRDFSPVSLLAGSPNILVAHPSLPVRSVKELIAFVKVRPGEINYASGTTGSSSHLAAELFKAMAGVNIVRILYPVNSQRMTAVVGGEAALAFPGAVEALQHVKSGRLRALAITSAKPSALAPGLPTMAETLPGFESASLVALFAPAKTPSAIINRLNQEVVRILSRADVKEKFFNTGNEVVGSSPEELAGYIKSDMAKIGKLVKDTGVHAD